MFRFFQSITLKCHSFYKKLSPHWQWLCALIILSFGLVTFNKVTGEVKALSDWSWIDILGEGGMALFIVICMLIVLATRTPGYTTSWLACGFIGIFIATFQDVLDEFIHQPSHVVWDAWVESLPIGLIMLIVGLILWYREQQLVNHYLHKRGPLLQNNLQLQGDTLLPQLPAFIKTVRLRIRTSLAPTKLVMLHISPANVGLPPLHTTDTSQLRLVIAETLVWNLPSRVQLFHLTSETYGLLMPEDTSKQVVLDLITLLRAIRYHAVHRTVPTRLQVYMDSLIIDSSSTDEQVLKDILLIQKTFNDKPNDVIVSTENLHV